jgi:hypothetical protein
MPAQRTQQRPRRPPSSRTQDPTVNSTSSQREIITSTEIRAIQQRYCDYLVILDRCATLARGYPRAEMRIAYDQASALIMSDPGRYPSLMPPNPTPEGARQWRREMVDPFANSVPMSPLECDISFLFLLKH